MDHIPSSLSRYKSPHLVFILVIFTYLLIGIAILKDYGESIDEQKRYRYAEQSLAVYLGAEKIPHDEKGPAYVMIAKIGSDILSRIHPQWLPINSWHFMHFLSYLMGLVFLYSICLRINVPKSNEVPTGTNRSKFLNHWGALGAVLLFSTQPLLWGHAFINSKDLPFMVFFLGSVALGLAMVDSYVKFNPEPTNSTDFTSRINLIKEWSGMEKKRKLIFIWFSAIVSGIFVAMLVARPSIHELIRYSIGEMYQKDSSNLVSRLFSQFAELQENIPVEYYIQKGIMFYQQIFFLYMWGTIILIFLASLWAFRQTTRETWRVHVKPFCRSFFLGLTNGRVIAAGVLLGLCSSIRTMGPASGILIGIYFLMKLRKKSWPYLLAYLVIGFLVTYLTWPNLWASPIRNYLTGLSKASNFSWAGQVLFAGIEYLPQDLPRSYLPKLLSIQFTETALLIFVFGILASAFRIYHKRIDWQLVLLVGMWFLVPFLAAVILHPTMYDNFRQFLFIIPPIFLIGSIGIQALVEWMNKKWAAILLIIVLILPGSTRSSSSTPMNTFITTHSLAEQAEHTRTTKWIIGLLPTWRRRTTSTKTLQQTPE